ncbi:putative lipoprotein [Corallococcus coralloides DSM 2259]|uniref:Putative lipoprotein n=1 Tax=Corallococcus coralloides (strain ATCC 25202 / DSM 2259 / NBRC 100086 / M2) TaxID=1144275 RepID=H8MSQ4_CORCM|nr:ELWxxDGT repeat protein [Corallococcus coralloides]AFE06219.1 putative lipoprotein [Corallococcus coralloides DSM 2259]
MRMRFGWILAGLSFVGCGGAQEMAPPSAQEPQVQAQACTPAMAATKVKDFLAPGDPLPSPYRPIPEWLTNVAGTLYFTSDPYQGTAALWRSDGTTVGTVPVKEFPYAGLNYRDFASLTAVGSRVFFTMEDPAVGSELWVSNGTAAGTQLVKDITPGAPGSFLSNLTALGGALTFFRNAGGAVELWRSDGTAAGTYRVVDFGAGSSRAYPTLHAGGALLFFLQDATQGTRLWRTDGTAAGTWLVKRVDAGGPYVTATRGLASGTGVFTLDDSSGTEVWRTDGTAAGTVRLDTFGKQARLLGSLGSYVYLSTLADDGERLKLSRLSLSGGGKTTVTTLPNPYPGQPDNTPYVQDSQESGGKLYLSVAISSPGPAPRQVGLWVTDGTAGGTRQLSQELTTADEYSSPLFDTGSGTLLFSSFEGDLGLMPQVTTGTPAGTGRVTTSSPGGERPEEFTRVGNTIYFRAYSGVWGSALWAVPANVTCTPLSASAR